MKHVYIIAAMVAGMMAAISLASKKEQALTGQVIINSSEMEAIWYPE
tara:strand:+ start:219 stop:359 length:141 start_codon:yes stop_codon:yes gene_type:complete